jgi:hypothetical protein
LTLLEFKSGKSMEHFSYLIDKSGFLSGLVNHAVSAAMRTIMKVF